MYDIVERIINHTWQSNYSGDQQYVYTIFGVLMIVVVVELIDVTVNLFRDIIRR